MMKRLIFSAVLIMACLITAQAQKFALIDMEYILKQIPAYEQANQKLETLSKQWQSEVEAKGKEAKALYESYQSTAAKLTAAQKTAKEDAIVAKEKEAAESAAQAEKEPKPRVKKAVKADSAKAEPVAEAAAEEAEAPVVEAKAEKAESAE